MGGGAAHKRGAAYVKAKRERGLGLRPDGRYLHALEGDDAAREWLGRRFPFHRRLVEQLLRQRRHDGGG